MNRLALIAALVPLAGCMNLADYGEAPGTERYGSMDYGYPGWWGRDAWSNDIFYDSLGSYGRWDSYPGYGRVWFPTGVGPGWQPYMSGQWVHDPRYGLRWVSRDPFGFATDHYGQWRRDSARGWYWIPGNRFHAGWQSPPIGWRPPPPGHPSWRPDRSNHDRPDHGRPDYPNRPGNGQTHERPAYTPDQSDHPRSTRPRQTWQHPEGQQQYQHQQRPPRTHSGGEGQHQQRPPQHSRDAPRHPHAAPGQQRPQQAQPQRPPRAESPQRESPRAAAARAPVREPAPRVQDE